MADLERSGRGLARSRGGRLSWGTLGTGIAIGLIAAFLVNLVVAAIIGLVKLAIIGTIAVALLYLVIVGPPSKR